MRCRPIRLADEVKFVDVIFPQHPAQLNPFVILVILVI